MAKSLEGVLIKAPHRRQALLWKSALKCEDEYSNPTPLGITGFKAFRSYRQEHPDLVTVWVVEYTKLTQQR